MFRRPGRNPALLVTGSQSLSQQTAGTIVKVALDTVTKDTAGWWDATNLRYIPQRPGLYLVTVGYVATQAIPDQQLADVAVAVNGTAIANAYSRWVASGSSYGVIGSAAGFVLLNGTTDYVEFFGSTNRSGGCTGIGYLGASLME